MNVLSRAPRHMAIFRAKFGRRRDESLPPALISARWNIQQEGEREEVTENSVRSQSWCRRRE